MHVKRRFIFDDAAKNIYLEHLERNGLFASAARAIGTTTFRVKQERETDRVFDESCNEAILLFKEIIEVEIRRRAITGVEEPVFYQGVATGGSITKFSDSLLVFMGKAKLPEYGDKLKIDQVITGGVLLTAAPAVSTESWLDSIKPAQLTDGSDKDEDIIDIEPVNAEPVPV